MRASKTTQPRQTLLNQEINDCSPIYALNQPIQETITEVKHYD